ncbi:MAG: hypothetical protein QM763_01960 [Agriterribacter sp.]
MHYSNVLTGILSILVFIVFILTFSVPVMCQENKKVEIKDTLSALLKPYLHTDTIPPGIKVSALKDSAKHSTDSLYRLVKDLFNKDSSGIYKDSLRSFLKQLINKPSDSTLKNKWKDISGNVFKQPSSLITIGGGYINYNYLFRSALDTPFIAHNLGQHMVVAGVDVSVADIPLRITYYGRQSNSMYLRDYNDFRVELNTPELNRVRQVKLRNRLNSVIQSVQKPELLNNINGFKNQINKLRSWLNGKEQLNLYLESKHNLAYGEKLPDDIGDKQVVLQTSKQVVEVYEQKKQLLSRYENALDSLNHIYAANSAKIQQLKELVNGNIYTDKGTQLIEHKLREDSLLDKKTSKLLHALYSIKTLAIGRTLPNMSNLTVKHLNVSGLNVEYNAGNLYAALVAGKIDFRTRDFIYGKPSRVPQYVYAASIGYGRKEGNHLIVTGYTGKKQIISNSNSSAMPLSGVSIRVQWVVRAYLRLAAEIAQSTSPVYTGDGNVGTKKFSFNDNTNKAYNIQAFAVVPGVKTRIDGYYQKTGINFQNFTNYRINANAGTWSIRAEQYVWKKQLRLQTSVRKNDYSNPYVVQQYNTNTVFTSFSATFRRRYYPSVTVGYMPASQYTVAGNEVMENRYQTFNITMSHNIHIGKMNANTTLMYNRFYNRSSDTAFLYYNANYFYAANQFIFPQFIANIGYARTANGQYSLDVMDGGLTLIHLKQIQFGCGVKINQYNNNEVRTGAYGNLRMSLKALGDITCWYERGYLPGAVTGLTKNEWFTLGFIRYLNNRVSIWKKYSD